MGETLTGAVGALRDLGSVLSGAASETPHADPGAPVFGGQGPGQLGDLGAALHSRWQTALQARAREAAAHGARVTDLAETLDRAGAGYTDVDHAASERKPEVDL
jgi:hypothetical protein